MDRVKLMHEFNMLLPMYSRTAQNVHQAIELLLSQNDIVAQTITGRVKDAKSFAEKCVRKSYKNPFIDNTDFVGIRIIVYLPKDIEKIEKILSKEFDVIEFLDKSKELESNEFGYRSHHLIVKIKKDWLCTPNYVGLENVCIEIQIRTILMHVWAEIEHKLQYKQKNQVPKSLQRKLFMLSAKVEEADEQFQSIVDEIDAYRSLIVANTTKNGEFDIMTELNLDTFKEFLSYYYGDKKKDNFVARRTYEEVIKHNLTFQKLTELVNKMRPYEKKLIKELGTDISSAGYIGYCIDLFIDKIRFKSAYDQRRYQWLD